jgi:hypothetical protein
MSYNILQFSVGKGARIAYTVKVVVSLLLETDILLEEEGFPTLILRSSLSICTSDQEK